MRLTTKFREIDYFDTKISVPNDARYLACDEIGDLFMYREEPKALDGMLGGGYYSPTEFALPYNFQLGDMDWKDTLVQLEHQP
jgi:hypothetical protein